MQIPANIITPSVDGVFSCVSIRAHAQNQRLVAGGNIFRSQKPARPGRGLTAAAGRRRLQLTAPGAVGVPPRVARNRT